MSALFKDVTIEVVWSRCHECGRWWARETGRNGVCPVCASDRINSALDAQEQAERSARSLRGALTRKRGR